MTMFKPWVDKAETDFETMTILMQSGRDTIYDAICYHAQQGVEKYLKAVLVKQNAPLFKTHDLSRLRQALANSQVDVSQLSDIDLEELNVWASDSRYPGVTASQQQAQQVYKISHQIRVWCRQRLDLI